MVMRGEGQTHQKDKPKNGKKGKNKTMARRKNVLTKTTTNKDEFLEMLSETLNAYPLKNYDIETDAHDLIGLTVFTIIVYKL